MQTPPGTTECNHSYYTGNSFSVSHSAQQLQNGTPATPAQPPASIQEVDAPASSGVISSSLLSCSAFSSQVTVDPTRYGTGDDMPLAEAITQLSFLEFLQRYHQFPSHFGMPLCRRLHLVTSLTRCPRRRLVNRTRFRVMWQFRRLSMVPIPYPWMLLRRRPHPVPCLSMSLRRWVLAQLPRFLLIRLCRLLYAVWCNMMLSDNYRSRSSSLAAFTRTALWTAKTLFVSLRHQCRVHMLYLSHRLDSNSQSLPLSLLLIRTCSPTLTVLPAMPSSRLSVPLKWEHTLYAQLPAPKGVLVPPWREPITLLAPIFVQTQASFPNQGQWFFPWSVLGNPSPTDLVPLPQLTAISCTINSDFPSFSGIQARRAEILPTSSLPPVVGFMQLSFRKPATMSRTSLITSERTPTTWTLLSCSTRTPLSQTLQSSHSRPTPRAKVRGAWYYSSFEACCAARLFLAHLQSHFARYTSTMLWPRNVMRPLEHNVDFIGGDFNMSAFSTVSDVFSDPEFSAPGHSCLWGLGALDEQHRECTGFLIMPKRPYEWRVDSHGCYKFDNAALGLGPQDQSAHLPVFLHLRNTNLPGPSSIMRSEQAQQRRYDRKHNKTERAKKRRS